MKLQIYSDLHTEFAPFSPPAVSADAVILAGDIGVKLGGLQWAIRQFPDRPVLYVPGNHEYYGAAIPHLTEKMRELARGTNVSVLDRDAAVLGGVRFLGATLWTDFALFGTSQRDHMGQIARERMTDFRRIRTSPSFSRLTPHALRAIHHQSRGWLSDRLSERFDGPTVVITHHAPTIEGMAPHHRDEPLAAAYASDLRTLLDGRAALWIHGHTHYRVDIDIGGTRVVANQRGYPDEPVEGFDSRLVLELPTPTAVSA